MKTNDHHVITQHLASLKPQKLRDNAVCTCKFATMNTLLPLLFLRVHSAFSQFEELFEELPITEDKKVLFTNLLS